MTSLLLDPRQLTSGSSTRATEMIGPPGQLDGGTDSIELDPSTLLAIARGLADSAQHWPGMGTPSHRVWDLMVASPDFEAWVIGWPPGGAIELHDHGESSGAVVVAQGGLLEVVVRGTCRAPSPRRRGCCWRRHQSPSAWPTSMNS